MKKDNEIKNIYYEKILENNKNFFSTIIPLIDKFNKNNLLNTNKKDEYGRVNYFYLQKLKKKLLSVYDFSYIDIDVSKILGNDFELTFYFRKEQISTSYYHRNPTNIQLDFVMSFSEREFIGMKNIEFFFREEDPCGEVTFDLTKEKIKYTIRHDITMEVSFNNFLEIDFYCNDLPFKNSLTSLFRIYPEELLSFFFCGTRLSSIENDFSLLQLDFDFNEVVGNDIDIPYIKDLDNKMNFSLIKKPLIKRLLKM